MKAPEVGLALRRWPVLKLSLTHMYYDMFLIGFNICRVSEYRHAMCGCCCSFSILNTNTCANVLYAHICI